jgi:hypothetical protein
MAPLSAVLVVIATKTADKALVVAGREKRWW